MAIIIIFLRKTILITIIMQPYNLVKCQHREKHHIIILFYFIYISSLLQKYSEYA